MCCGECPYCGRSFEGEEYEVLKEVLKEHMKKEHYNTLLEESKGYKYCRIFGKDVRKDVCIEWLAGLKAYRSIRYC